MNENQKKILDLAKKKDISRMGPRQIMRETGIEHPQTVVYHLEKLKEKGLIYHDSRRAARVAKPKAFSVDNFFNIPVVGSANCGQALELAQEDIQGYLRISKKTVSRSKPNGLIAVRAIGESLNKADIEGDNIENGDYVVVDCEREPSDGDYVLSVIDGAANFKRFYKDNKKHEIRLVSESTLDIPPIVLHEDDISTSGYLVNGVAIKVVKN